MSDPVEPVPGAKVIRLDQWVKRRQRATCEHIEVVVDDDHPSLECVTCGAAVDPWYWIRQLAERSEQWQASWDAVQKDKLAEINHQIEQHNAMVVHRNEKIARLNEQIRRLEDRKRSLEPDPGSGGWYVEKTPKRGRKK